MSTTLRTKSVCVALFIGAAALIPHGRSLAALTNNVPLDWKSPTLANNAYLENFELAVPTWASVAGQTTQAVNLAGFYFPTRSNTWFTGLSTNVLILNGNVAVTNSFTNTSGVVSFATNALFVDMRIKFESLTEAPASALLQPAKLALYVNSNSNLVAAVYNNTWYTNSTRLDITNWYQLTVKLTSNKFSVLTNDVPAFTNLPLNNLADSNTLRQLCITGSGALDELYVSYGNPAYAGLPGSVPPTAMGGGFPGAGGASVTNWLADYFNDGRISSAATLAFTTAQIDAAYLLNEIDLSNPNSPQPVPFSFSISSIDMTTPTNITVGCSLITGGSAKTGRINGRIQLLGRQTWSGDWVSVSDPVTPEFSNGTAICNFVITATPGYTFFHPQIVP
jgi:hypothetical protein